MDLSQERLQNEWRHPLRQIVQTDSRGLPFNEFPDSFPGVKRQGCEFNNSHAHSAEAKNEWRYESSLSIGLHGVDRKKFYHSQQIFLLQSP